ncbi:helix-turn-helix domain-containing protein [Eubacteriaceae bacterium ES2]|nr:helix-turn-helix domain-containing protein [Eubacteriaceae bacterium ES2]
MELSLSIIKERLEPLVTDCYMRINAEKLILGRPVFFQDQKEISSNTLYIVSPNQPLADRLIPKEVCFIFVGNPTEIPANPVLSYLSITDTITIFELSNRIHEIFDFFEEWDLNLQQGIREHQSLQYLLDLSEPVFQNGMSIMNPDYHIIAQTSLVIYDINFTEELGTDEFGRLKPEQVNSFKNDDAYLKVKDEKAVFIYPKKRLPYRTLCKNIFHNQTFLFRIVVFENHHPFLKSDETLLEYFGQYLNEDSEYLLSIDHSDFEELAELLDSIMLGKAYHQADLKKELKKLGWELSHAYCLAAILPSEQDIFNQTLTYFCSKIQHDYENTFAIVQDEQLVAFFNLDRIADRQKFFDSFSAFIKDSNFKVGYSNELKDFRYLDNSYKEAQIALAFGNKIAPEKDSYFFSDYVLDYLFEQMTKDLPAANLSSPILSRLEEYDQKNDTEYVKTLSVYLKNNMNALKTAKELCIHRGTIVYRLERIKEIGKLDFENTDELLHVNISLKFSSQINEVNSK